MTDDTLQQIITTLSPEDKLGVILAVQLGGTPQEVQVLLQTMDYNTAQDALTPTGQYIVRAIGVQEHRVSVGLFRTVIHSHDIPLLYPHNSTPMIVNFKGELAQDRVDSLMIDLNQLYGQTYGIYDPCLRMANELNRTQPLAKLLTSGEGILGVMPAPFASKAQTVLEKYELAVELVEYRPADLAEHDHHDMQHQALVMDDSFIVAQMFSVDPMG